MTAVFWDSGVIRQFSPCDECRAVTAVVARGKSCVLYPWHCLFSSFSPPYPSHVLRGGEWIPSTVEKRSACPRSMTSSLSVCCSSWMLSGCGSAGQPKEMTIVVIQTLRVRAGICLVCCKSVVWVCFLFLLCMLPQSVVTRNTSKRLNWFRLSLVLVACTKICACLLLIRFGPLQLLL